MKIGILSDIHMNRARPWDFVPEADVFYICAGDISEDHGYREEFIQNHNDHMFAILGNHDYYDSTFSDAYLHLQSRKVGDIKIAGATLWTDLSNPLDWIEYTRNLIDKRYIKDLNHEDMIETHRYHKKFLFTSNADIIVSHHTPAHKSIHERYRGDAMNCCFSNDLEEDILLMRNPPKLWIHGHTHDRFDYMIGQTRVICHPRGYSGEHTDHKTYEPMIVEI